MSMMRIRTLALVLASSTALTACTVGPDYHAASTPPVAAGPFIGAATAPAVTAAAPEGQWWRLYDDPVLDGLVADALGANTDIRVAVARLERARAVLHGAKADRLPRTDIQASETYNRLPQYEVLPGEPRQFRQTDAGISVSYEVDLFGRVKRSIQAARGDYQATQEDTDAVRVTVVADTVRAYVDAAASAERIAVAQHTIDLLDRGVRITTAREEHGLNDKLDVIRVTQLRDQQAAAIPALQSDRDAALFRLATLTGRAPADLPATAGARTTTPDVTQPIPVGDGRALLARRPDVRAAERRLAADTARIGVATADLYPKITLGGAIGTTQIGAADVFGGGPLRWLVGPMLSWAFPNNAAVRARIGEAKADTKADLATFDGTVLRALEETETALSAYRGAAQREEKLISARDLAARAANASLGRQRTGRIDFLSVLDAQRTLADSEADLALAKQQVAVAQVDLFRALGGSWQGATGPQVATAARP
jgi:multidrug efflux system outer membrane protein